MCVLSPVPLLAGGGMDSGARPHLNRSLNPQEPPALVAPWHYIAI